MRVLDKHFAVADFKFHWLKSHWSVIFIPRNRAPVPQFAPKRDNTTRVRAPLSDWDLLYGLTAVIITLSQWHNVSLQHADSSSHCEIWLPRNPLMEITKSSPTSRYLLTEINRYILVPGHKSAVLIDQWFRHSYFVDKISFETCFSDVYKEVKTIHFSHINKSSTYIIYPNRSWLVTLVLLPMYSLRCIIPNRVRSVVSQSP